MMRFFNIKNLKKMQIHCTKISKKMKNFANRLKKVSNRLKCNIKMLEHVKIGRVPTTHYGDQSSGSGDFCKLFCYM
jgi:RecA-family ATPase